MALLQNVLFIDGITRSGKSMVAPMFRSSDVFDPLVFSYDLEYVMAGLVSNQLSKEFAKSFFIKVINERIYDSTLGRNFNFRSNEISSIDKMVFIDDLKRRLDRKDGDDVLNVIKNQNVISPFFTHDMALHYDIFLSLELEILVIEVLRSPIEITYSWISKRWGERQLSDPRSFKHTILRDGILVPWQAKDFALEWLNATVEERCALVVVDSTAKLLNQLQVNRSAQLLPVFYEDFATQTQSEVFRIARFLKVDPYQLDLSCLVSERLPRVIDPEVVNVLQAELEEILSPTIFELLLKSQEEFQSYRKLVLQV